MSDYNGDFYESYKAYLVEPKVRKAHNWIFEVASLNPDFNSVVDFGCGQFNEFYVYAKPKEYTGLDLNVESSQKGNKRLLKTDYLACKDLQELLNPRKPTAFVSLFSTEIIQPTEKNYAFYNRIFEQLPTVKSGLVSGFFYVSRKNQNPIAETGGIESYQTLENIEDVEQELFTEKRIVLPVPSKMFGRDVFEVWKFFEKKQL